MKRDVVQSSKGALEDDRRSSVAGDVLPPLSIGRGRGTIEKEEGVGERKNRKGEEAAIKPAEE